MIGKITKQDEKQLEKQVSDERDDILEIIRPIIARYVGFKASSILINKKIVESLESIEGRLKVIEHILKIPKIEE